MRSAVLFLLCACESSLATTITLSSGLTVDEIQSTDVYVLSNRSVTGEPVGCELLLGGVLAAPAFDTFIVVRHTVAGAAAAPTDLTDLPAGTTLVVAIEAYATPDALSAPIAFGCAENVALEKGKQTRIDITLVAP